MGLIKSTNPAATKPVTFSMADIEASAKAMLLRARQQADQLLAAAQSEGEVLKEELKAQGLAEGKALGLQQGRDEGKKLGEAAAINENKAKLTQLIAAMTKASTELENSRKKLLAEAEQEVVKLSIAIARKVTKSQGESDPAVLQANIADAMKFVVSQADVRIGLHPSQKTVFADLLPKLKASWPNLQHVEIIEDPSIAPGGARIFTRGGRVDADLDTQIDRIARELIGEKPQMNADERE